MIKLYLTFLEPEETLRECFAIIDSSLTKLTVIATKYFSIKISAFLRSPKFGLKLKSSINIKQSLG